MKKIFILLNFILFAVVSKAQIFYVQEMNTTEIAALDKEKTVVLLQGGILEEHGPYLPCFCDGYQNQALTQEVASSIVKRNNWKVLIFPIIPLGVGGANEIGGKYSFSGTYAVRQSTLRAVLMDWATELGEQGFKKIFVIHAHGAPNHNQAIDQACDYFTETYHGRMVNIVNLSYLYLTDFRNESEKKEDGFTVHAGMDETSVLYYLKPEFKKNTFKEAKPTTAQNPEDLVSSSKNVNWQGYFGSPRLASSEFGKKHWEIFIKFTNEQVMKVLENKYDFSQPTFFQKMAGNSSLELVNEEAKKEDKEREAKQNKWLKSKGFD